MFTVLKKKIMLDQKDNNPKTSMDQIHVMHVIDKLSVAGSGIHGVTRIIDGWVSNFDRARYRFTIVSLRTPEKAGEIFERKHIPIYFLSRGKLDPRTLWDLMRLIRQEKPDVLHLHGWGATNFGRLASFLKGIPNIVHEYAVLINQPFYQTIADSILSPLTNKALAVSNGVYDFMVSYRKINPKKLETMLTGFPVNDFREPDESIYLEERQRLGILPDEQVVCTVGRLAPLKGQEFILKAALRILEECPNTRFLIVGQGPERERLESIAQEIGIANKVIFTGFHRDVAICLALSDVFAMTSLSEGMPITIFEAMNLKKPIVAFPAGGISDVIQDGANGFLVPFKDIDLLAKRIIYLLKNPRQAQAIGKKAWEDCQKYDVSHAVKRLDEIYMELVS